MRVTHSEPQLKMFFLLLGLLLLTVGKTSQLAQPKGFKDDPYVDDDKFIEKGGQGLFNIIVRARN